MSRIILCSREWSSSTGRYVRTLVEYLEKIDTTSEYIILMKPGDIKKWQPTNPNFRAVACPHAEFSIDEQLGLKKQIESLNPDLVHFTMVQQPVWYKGKVVTTMHDLTTMRFRNPDKNPIIFTFKQQVYKWVNKKVAEKSDAIFTPTQFVKDDVANYTKINGDKIVVTYEAADPINDPAEEVTDLKDTRFIMYIGRPTPHKNLSRLIDAFQLLKKDDPDLHLVLAGKKDNLYSEIEQNALSRGIPDVVFTDYISDGQLRWLYQNCAAYVFPSLSEGFGLPGLEAMIHKAPVVSSNATCLPEVYGDAALYFDPTDVNDMYAKIKTVIEDETIRNDLIAKGEKQAAKYSWQRMAEQTLAVYKRVLQDDK